jgi:hypothetical protein
VTWDTVIDSLWNDAPLVAVLAFILLGGYRRWWVWGYQLTDAKEALDAMTAERDKWVQLAWKSADSTRTAVNTTEKVIDVLRAER